MVMGMELNPIVIVVSGDSDNNKLSLEDRSQLIADNNMKTCDKESIITNNINNKVHSTLCKYHSYPIQDRKRSNNHLNVPSTVSSNSTDCSVYSSEDSLQGNVKFSSCENCTFTSSSSQELSFVDRCSNNTEDSQQSLHVENMCNCTRRNLLFPPHNPLTRALSAPLKSNEQITITNRNGFSHNIAKSPSRVSLFISPKGWKNIVKRTNSARKSALTSPNNFSLRRTVSNSFRGLTKENSHFISLPSKNKKKTRQRYRIVEAKTGQRDGLSFEVVGKQGFYLRAKGSLLITDKDTTDTHFNKDCTYVPLPDMWFPSFFAFESVSKPSYFIRLTSHEELVLEKYDGTHEFKEEASFQLTRKPCASCLQVGSQTWAKKKSGEFCRGKVTSIAGKKVEVQFDNGKADTYRMSDAGHLVPDIIPRAEDITVGTKVIAQWLSRHKLYPGAVSMSRHKLYPGVVSGIRGGDNYEIVFDDGDISGDKKAYQLRVMRAYYFHEEGAPNSPLCSPCNGGVAGVLYDSPNSNHCNKNDISIHHHFENKFKENWRSELCSTDSNLDESTVVSDILSTPVQSGNILSSISNDNIQNTNSLAGQLSYAPWETFSQDSGYHGFAKRKEDKVGLAMEISNISRKHPDRNQVGSVPTPIAYHNRHENHLVRSKSLDDVRSSRMYKISSNRNKSSSFGDPCVALSIDLNHR